MYMSRTDHIHSYRTCLGVYNMLYLPSHRRLTGPVAGGGAGWSQSGYDPCYFFKTLDDGSRINMALYVDDGYVVDSGSPLADAELARLHDRFTIAVKEAKFFLGNNIAIGAP